MIESRILYQNSSCLVVNKLKGEAMEGAVKGMIDLPKLIKTELKLNFIEAVHRLDVPVTGCALFALTKESLAFLNKAFADNPSAENSTMIEKRYWAITKKTLFPLPESGELVHFMEINTKINKSTAFDNNSKNRKKAVLRYRITGEGKNYLFLEILLLSGRHHQIRAQLAAVGLHIKGDLKYGAKRSEKGGGIRLHARSLSFPNPLNKDEKICVTANPPEADALWEAFVC